MTRVLAVTNGHGEASIADRIAQELRRLDPSIELEHLALVGDGLSEEMTEVGPQRAMPSGGLIAMGNVTNIARDVKSGLLGLTLAQYRFLRRSRGRYAAALAIGDVYALMMTLAARTPTVFVGTAKSVNFAPYGPVEERVLSRARARFVRDDPTVERLRAHGLAMEDAANVIVDLFQTGGDPRAAQAVEGFDPVLALFPGSRESAYADAAFLLGVARELARERPALGAVLSVARNLDARRFAADAARDGWEIVANGDPNAAIPFTLRAGGRDVARAWRGALGPLLSRASVVLGQAGTANEAAAAAGVPIVAFEIAGDRNTVWYRKRQLGLLGDAMIVLPREQGGAVRGVGALLDDPARRTAMGEMGRTRMGPSGGAARIATRVVQLVRSG